MNIFKLFHIKEKVQLDVLKDLKGKPFKFYRGKEYDDISVGRFFCSCFESAYCYRVFDKDPIFETEIAVRIPLIIDATEKNKYSSYNSLMIRDCKLYPEEKRKDLIQYLEKINGYNTLSADEILHCAMQMTDIDAVIIKNVIEGINTKLPIYDVMIWNKRNLVNTRNVLKETDEFNNFRENTFKRMDLSAYILENERDGIVNIINGDGYIIEHTIQRGCTNCYLEHELVVNTSVPINIYCLDMRNFVTAEKLEAGVYENTFGMTSRKKFVPDERGIVRVKKMSSDYKYRIKH